MKKIYTLISVLIISTQLFAGGFQINEQGAKAMSMADAFTGIANNPSAIYFNPAGLTQLDGTQFLGGISLIAPDTKFIGPSPLTTEWKMDNQIFTPFDIYATHKFNENWYAGLSVNNQYGLGTKWPADWVGNQLAIETNIKSYFFTPVVAYKFSDQFSLSVGGVVAIADVKIVNSRELAQGAAPFQLSLDGNKTSYGFTAGVMYKPINELSFGLSYRSQIKFDFKGNASSTPSTTTIPIGGNFVPIPNPNGSVTAPLKTPQNITFGIGVFPSPDLTLSADFQYVGWSSYDKLTITFNDYRNPLTGAPVVVSADRNYQNTFIIRGGAEYKLSDVFALRGGIYFDKNPIKDNYVEPQLPDANRIGYNVGFGYKFTPRFGVDFAYMLLTVADRTVTNSVFGFNGTYKNLINVAALDLSYSL